jgi:hypothetical protein
LNPQFPTVIGLICGLRNELSNHDYLNNVRLPRLLIQSTDFIVIFVCFHSSFASQGQIARTAPFCGGKAPQIGIDVEFHEYNHHCGERNIDWKEKIEGVIRLAG